MSFASDMERFAKKMEMSLDDVAVTVCGNVVKGVINETPVDKGGAKANWVATINKSFDGTVSGTDKSGASTIADGLAIANKAAGNIFYLTNNLPYIRKLEYGGYSDGPKIVGGFSKKAPRGMVRVTMQIVKMNLRRYSK